MSDEIDADVDDFEQASEMYDGRGGMDTETRILLLEERTDQLLERVQELEDLCQMAAERLREQREQEEPTNDE